MLLLKELNLLGPDVVFLVELLFLYLFLQVLYAFQQCLDLARVHLSERLYLLVGVHRPLGQLPVLLSEFALGLLELLNLPLQHDDHLVLRVFHHFRFSYYSLG